MTGRTGVCALVALALSACSDDVLAPGVDEPVPCVLGRPFPADAIEYVTVPGLIAALEDADVRVIPSLADSVDAALMHETMNALGEHVQDRATDASCQSVRLVRSLIARQADEPRTKPGRAALEFILDVVESTLSAEQ
jgi:hypothetical protein